MWPNQYPEKKNAYVTFFNAARMVFECVNPTWYGGANRPGTGTLVGRMGEVLVGRAGALVGRVLGRGEASRSGGVASRPGRGGEGLVGRGCGASRPV